MTHRYIAVRAERTLLEHLMHLKPDCSEDTFPSALVISPPQQGTIDLVLEEAYPKSNGHDAKCSAVKRRAVTSYYTSAPGYIGADTAKARLSFGDGRVIDETIEVNVVQ